MKTNNNEHYYIQQSEISIDDWKIIRALIDMCFQELPLSLGLFDASGENQLLASSELFINFSNTSKAYDALGWDIEGEVITFNGCAKSGVDAEHFVLARKNSLNPTPQLCRTEGKPYDFFVIVVLLIINKVAPDAYEITSTVNINKWRSVADWVSKAIGGHACQIPEAIEKNTNQRNEKTNIIGGIQKLDKKWNLKIIGVDNQYF